MLHAPSSSEYSEWTCRCATVGELIGVETIGVASDRIGARPATCVENNGARDHLFVARRAPRGQRVRDLHGPRRVGALGGCPGGGARGVLDLGGDGRVAAPVGRAGGFAVRVRGGAGGPRGVGGDRAGGGCLPVGGRRWRG